MKIGRTIFAAAGLVMLAFFARPAEVSADTKYYCFYEDGTPSKVYRTYPGSDSFHTNGVPVILKDGKLYEDVAPYGVFDENDRHIYTNRGFYEKDSYCDLKPERLESWGEIYVDTDENGNAADQFVVDHTSLKEIRINQPKGIKVKITGSDIDIQYIENIGGNIDYTLTDCTDGSINFFDQDAAEEYDRHRDTLPQPKDAEVKGNVNLNIARAENVFLSFEGMVWGNTNITVNQSKMRQMTLANHTGHNGKKGNVTLQMTDSSSENIIGLNGQPYRTAGEGSSVNGDIELNLTRCSGIGVYGYTDFTDDDYGEVNQVTGKSTIRMKNCNFRTLSDKSYKCGEEDISTTSVAYLEDTTIVDSYDDPVCVNEVHVKGHLIGGIAANDIRLEENAKVTGNIAVYKVISGQGEFWSYKSCIGFAADAKPAAGTKIKIVPVKKSTNASTPYVPYNKTEQMKNRIGIWFLSKENPDLYRSYFTCDYNKLESISSNGYRTELRVKNAVACNGNHNWAKAADCGWSDIEMYASVYDKEANHTEYGKETYYCTACLAYEVRNTPKKVEHDYVAIKVVEPTTEQGGYTVYYCRYTDCNEHYKGNFTNPLPKPSTDTDQKPSTDTDQKPSTDTDQKPSTDTDQKPSTDTDQKPSTDTDQKPSTDTDQKPSTDTGQKPSTDTDQKPSTDTDQKPSTDTNQKPSTDTDQKPSTDTDQKPSTDTDKKLVKKTYIAVSKLKVTLTSKVTYNGKAQKPSVVVKYGSKKLKNGTDYKLSYKNNKNIGTATITLTGKGNYQGTRRLTFGILPKKAFLTEVRSKKAKTAQVKWRKDSSASGYVIYYSTDPKFKEGVKKLTISKNKTTSTILKNLKAKKTYYVKAASYKKTGGKTYIGSYSATKKVRIK